MATVNSQPRSETPEKLAVISQEPLDVDTLGPIVQDWTEEEERKARRKVDFILLPVLGLGFFALQLDRGNIASALTSTLTKDLGITTNDVNVGNQLLSAGIVLLEIPSNIVLQKVGPRLWLSIQIVAWGLVATFQAFITNYAGFLVTRLLLGLLEAGFIPGALYFLSTWYKREETSFRTILFFFGQMFSSATSALIGAGLLTLNGKSGLAGWQWLWLVEGLITLFIAIIFWLFLPPAVGDGKALISRLAGGRWNYFTERETHILTQRVILDDPQKAKGKLHITGKDLMTTFSQPRIWIHVLITMFPMVAVQGLGKYTPSIIKSFGFDTIKANALSSIAIYCAIFFVGILAFFCDFTGQRGPFILIAATWTLISYSCLRTFPPTSSAWHKFTLITLSNIPYASVHMLNLGWMSVNCITPQERSISLALIVMSANCAGIAGSQVFRTEDAPKYAKGLSTIIGLAAGSWLLILGQTLGYHFWPRNLNPETENVEDSERDIEK